MGTKKILARKYRMKDILDGLPYGERKETFHRIVKELDIHPNAFHRILAIKESDTSSISVDKMKIIADILNVTVDDLIKSPSEVNQ